MASPRFKFRLYIAADTQNSAEALANLTGICQSYLPGCHDIEVIDVNLEPKRTLADGINMTPTLIKLAPAPFRKIVGTLAHTKRVLLALDITDTKLRQEISDPKAVSARH